MAAGQVWLGGPARDETPDALVIGHITRDLISDAGEGATVGDGAAGGAGGAGEPGWRLGGSALYAALTLARLGMRVAALTSAPTALHSALEEALPGVALAVVPCEEATTFQNRYLSEGRRQYLRGRGGFLTPEALPDAWRAAPLALMAPVAGELRLGEMAGALTPGGMVGATPQGWLRRWDADGRVAPLPLEESRALRLEAAQALILSREDLVGPGADETALARADEALAAWAQRSPLVVVTRGASGADLWRAEQVERFPGYPAREVDPTGAGDVFAATFLYGLTTLGDPARAMVLANRVAAMSVEGVGASAIPTQERLLARYPARA